MNYYNENEPFCVAWLRELIKEGHIADGYVDDRSITDIKAHELTGFNQYHFFAGIGIWSHSLRRAGVSDDEPLWTASCPCQPFSQTGKQLGNADSRHLFPTLRKLVARLNPARVIGEQVASKLGREWLARVRLEMATLGYATRGTDTCSAGVGSPNIRQRLYWLADTDGREPWNGRVQSGGEHGQLAQDCGVGGLADASGTRTGRDAGTAPSEEAGVRCSRDTDGQRGSNPLVASGTVRGLGHTHNPRPQGRDERRNGGGERTAGAAGMAGTGFWDHFDILHCTDGKARRIEPGSFPLVTGCAGRVDKLRGYGNCINGEVAAAFIKEACPEICALRTNRLGGLSAPPLDLADID